jgi:hypothetical protein
MLAQDGELLWDRPFVQLWHQMFSPDGDRIAAVVAPRYGRWTVAIDGLPWEQHFKDMVTDAVFSPNGKRVGALAKEGQNWYVVTDGIPWSNSFDMAWQPVFSPDGEHVAAKIEKNGKFAVALNDHLSPHICDVAWDPIFSPEGDKILLRSIEDNTYYRRVVPVGEFAR